MTNSDAVTRHAESQVWRGEAATSCAPLLSTLVKRVEALAQAVEQIEGRLDTRAAQANGSPGEAAAQPQRLTAGQLMIDHDARRAYIAGRPVELSLTEYKILSELARNPGRVVTVSDLMRRARGGFSPDKSYVKVYIGRLRAKMDRARGETPCAVETVRGVGYRLVA